MSKHNTDTILRNSIGRNKVEKTNVMRLLDAKKIRYEGFSYPPEITDGEQVAAQLGEDAHTVFKTLVTVSDKNEHLVFVVPVCASLDLKSAAKAANVKSVAMIRQRELEPLTGYIHGGCSPIGMKKRFRTFIDVSAESLDSIFVSAGKVGHQIKISPNDLADYVGAVFVPLC